MSRKSDRKRDLLMTFQVRLLMSECVFLYMQLGTAILTINNETSCV